jgi:Pyridoxamine 5'-phosphate oxidase
MPTTTATSYHDVVDLARPIVERVVWCTVTTVSPGGAPRSRLMHPVWSWDGEAPFALVTARPTPLKVRHLAAHPHVACFYWDPAHDTVAIDATAVWVDAVERRDAWRQIAEVSPPVGFDPAIVWPEGPEAADCAFLRFEARRVVVTPAGRPGLRWTAPVPAPDPR